MNSGFLTVLTKGKLKKVGVHQRLDQAAYSVLKQQSLLKGLPDLSDILFFEGYNGPDGLKVKGKHDTNHLWEPIEEIGQLKRFVKVNFDNTVAAIRNRDDDKAAFEMAWLAHFLTDGLTPAHHIDDLYMPKIRRISALNAWEFLKSIPRQHVIFESLTRGVLWLRKIDKTKHMLLVEEIKKEGIEAVFVRESKKIAKLDIYNKFLDKGWSLEVAHMILRKTVPSIVILIASAWAAARDIAYEPKG
jgi:hypothetical protein